MTGHLGIIGFADVEFCSRFITFQYPSTKPGPNFVEWEPIMKKDHDIEVDVAGIAKLARLKLSAAEVNRFQGEVESILEYIRLLSEVNLEGIEPTAHAISVVNVYRPDEAGPTMDKSLALENAPEVLEDDYIKVPVVIDSDDQGGP
jgi:aspartyl-tRNA(Asn)/glutamyl-tRNA(Gln) amidotransferase subunit C